MMNDRVENDLVENDRNNRVENDLKEWDSLFDNDSKA